MLKDFYKCLIPVCESPSKGVFGRDGSVFKT